MRSNDVVVVLKASSEAATEGGLFPLSAHPQDSTRPIRSDLPPTYTLETWTFSMHAASAFSSLVCDPEFCYSRRRTAAGE